MPTMKKPNCRAGSRLLDTVNIACVESLERRRLFASVPTLDTTFNETGTVLESLGTGSLAQITAGANSAKRTDSRGRSGDSNRSQ